MTLDIDHRTSQRWLPHDCGSAEARTSSRGRALSRALALAALSLSPAGREHLGLFPLAEERLAVFPCPFSPLSGETFQKTAFEQYT
jgi:hypothetical protein